MMWIFGYGSIIWKPGFPWLQRYEGWVDGWSRRFWQGSPDHRGTMRHPGRVVTMMREPGAKTWGVAYAVDTAMGSRVIATLDKREQGGYLREMVPFCPRRGQGYSAGGPLHALVYTATSDNPHFMGHGDASTIAGQIMLSWGPSGPNTEYLIRLANALRAMGAVDEHVFEIERALRARLPESQWDLACGETSTCVPGGPMQGCLT